jgi:hypothetical protein
MEFFGNFWGKNVTSRITLLLLQRLYPRFSAKPRQVVVERHPVDTIRKVIMGLWRAIDFAFDIGQNNINVLWMIGRLAKERAAAHITERPPTMIRRLVNLQMILASRHAEL